MFWTLVSKLVLGSVPPINLEICKIGQFFSKRNSVNVQEYHDVILIGLMYCKVIVVIIIFIYDYDTTQLKGILLQMVKEGEHPLRRLLMGVNVKLKKVIHLRSKTIAATHYEATRAIVNTIYCRCERTRISDIHFIQYHIIKLKMPKLITNHQNDLRCV